MITQTLKLNLIPGQVLPRVNVSQYDAGTRTLQMLLYNGDQTFNISAGVGGFVQGTKPDRTGFQYPATVTQGSNVVTLVITQQMTAVSGEVTCELVLADGDNRIATVNFIIYVEPAALADDTVISDTELPLIEEAAELAQRIDGIAQQVSDDADRAETAADNAELWASRSPYIGQNGNWFVFDTTTEAYIDTQISATGPQGQTGPTGPQGPQGDAATITVGTVTTLPAGSQATVTNSGTSEEAVFNFGIPKGQDGTGAGDMTKADYDANGAVENAGGIASYVSTAISGKANSADLGTAAYKDSTNAVTSGSTDPVESGAVYTELATRDAEISAMNNVLGAKNLLPNNATSQVVNDVTFTVNTDGSITANGTAGTGNVILVIAQSAQYSVETILSGGKSAAKFLRAKNLTTGIDYDDTGNGVILPQTNDAYRIYLCILEGTPVSETFYPMIRPSSIKDDTFVPYAMTNSAITNSLRVGNLAQFRAGREESLNADFVDFARKDQSFNRIVFFENNNDMVFQHYDANGALLSQYDNFGVTGVAPTITGSPFANVSFSRSGRVVNVSTFQDITTNWTDWSGVAVTGFPKPLLEQVNFSYALYNGALYSIINRISTDGNLYVYSPVPIGTTVRILINMTYITNDQ